MWLTDFKNIHTYIFMGLALCLLGSIKFFVSELRAIGNNPANASTNSKEKKTS
jgi:hypothetical protein